MAESEFRLYGFILDSLKDLGWDTRSPRLGGSVFTQHEALDDPGLKAGLGARIPENVVSLGNSAYWAIEAKADPRDIGVAVQEAQGYAEQIGSVPGVSCQIATGVAGNPDTTHYIESHFFDGETWKRIYLNGRPATGFISHQQVQDLLRRGTGELEEFHLDEQLFKSKAALINKTLHEGRINNRNRASVLACLLLALAEDQDMSLSEDPTTLIQDINTRAKAMLRKYGQDAFFPEISINLPTSQDNHIVHRKALTKATELLRGLNIASAIDSGWDVLGEFYEQFLKYANDAKEVGIVLTPRHITSFAAEIVNVGMNDVVFDPACGTGGFLVAALDRVRRKGGNINQFKKGNLHGIDSDQLVATLAIVNMIFRGDGSSNIVEGDCFTRDIPVQADKALLNPPFAMPEPEWRFVDRALETLKPDGLLFAIMPITAVGSVDDGRGEITWRRQMLQRHTLLAVIKLPEPLFYPHASKGTVGVVLRAHRPHKHETDTVIWAVLEDGVRYTKTKVPAQSNMAHIAAGVGNYLATATLPTPLPQKLDYRPIADSAGAFLDLSPESHIDSGDAGIEIASVIESNRAGHRRLAEQRTAVYATEQQWRVFSAMNFMQEPVRGKSGRLIDLPPGRLPLISTKVSDNGISGTVDPDSVNAIYPPNRITISANGSSCQAFWHDYEFAANGDVFVVKLRQEFDTPAFGVFLCAAINNESWRFNYYRKFSTPQLQKLEVKLPATPDGMVDMDAIKRLVKF